MKNMLRHDREKKTLAPNLNLAAESEKTPTRMYVDADWTAVKTKQWAFMGRIKRPK